MENIDKIKTNLILITQTEDQLVEITDLCVSMQR